MIEWNNDVVPVPPRISAAGWVRALARGLVLGSLTYGSLLILVLVRLIERPLCGLRRPVTPYITQLVCRAAFAIMGMGYSVRGRPMREVGAVVGNHASWLDIFSLNAPQRIYFVSKAQVANWPFIGWLARATGTVFINRKGSEAKLQQEIFEERLRAGHRLMFFPEGTSTDGLRIVPFKSTLFAAFFTPELKNVMHIQPVTVVYRAPPGEDPRFYGWWGDMDFAPHLLQVLAARRQGSVEVVFHPPVRVDAFANRKTLAAHCEAEVRSALPSDLVALG